MNLLARDLWQEVQNAFRAARGPAVAGLWLQQARPLGFVRGVFTLGVPNEVVRDWLEHRYSAELEGIFRRLTGSAVRLLLKVDASLPAAAEDAAGAKGEESGGAAPEAAFVIRPENRLASAALARLLDDPATGNPLFLYGPPGVGKSALVRHRLIQHQAERGARTTISVTADAFSAGLVYALRENQLPAFRGRMLAAEAFVLEEAHRLRGKTRTQREFLSVLQYHVLRGRPVILTSRHPPNAIFLLDEGLRSYFLSGILHRIADYSVPSRAAILEAAAARFARPVPAETIERVARRVNGPVSRQIHFLEKAAACAALAERPATLEFLGGRFPELSGSSEGEVDVGSLIALAARDFGSTAEDIASNRKTRSAVLARHVVVYVATVVFNLKARRVMRHLGGLSPSTTAYARRRIEERRRDDPVFDARVRRLLAELKTGQKLLF
ncbi:MAG: hypothetical protein HY812_10580 [Planctomycetes bacterium]|nr:hypothetical protein [Planctomycetota bacterium]